MGWGPGEDVCVSDAPETSERERPGEGAPRSFAISSLLENTHTQERATYRPSHKVGTRVHASTVSMPRLYVN